MKDLKLDLEDVNLDLENLDFNIEESWFNFEDLDLSPIEFNIPNESFDLPNIEINQPIMSDEELKQMCLDMYNKATDMLINRILSWELSYKETKRIIRVLAKSEWIHVWRAPKWHKWQITTEEKMAFNKILEKRWIKVSDE